MSQSHDSLWQDANVSTTRVSDSDIVVQVNGTALIAKPGDTVATALLRAGYKHFAVNAKTGLPLAPSCFMGVCFGCVCTIDGRSGTLACLEPVRHGQVITTDNADQ